MGGVLEIFLSYARLDALKKIDLPGHADLPDCHDNLHSFSGTGHASVYHTHLIQQTDLDIIQSG